MREVFEFRIEQKRAATFLGEGIGKKIGESTMLIHADRNDLLFTRIRDAEADFKRNGRCFFSSYDEHREFTAEEWATAKYFSARIRRAFEPAGEECGTAYDVSAACPQCEADRRQVGSLHLRISKIPKVDISKTIAGEIVISERVRAWCETECVLGVRFEAVVGKSSRSADTAQFWQPVFSGESLVVCTPTKTGIDPFDDDPTGRFVCPCGLTIGLNRLSVLSFRCPVNPLFDIACTRQRFGYRSGLLRPEPQIVVSRRFWELWTKEKFDGLWFEPADARPANK